MTPTTQQTAFVTALVSGVSHVALVARAGTGKTSTIILGVQAYHRAFPLHEILVLAYNKAIADEVGGKLKAAGLRDWQKVNASTIHSLGWGLVRFTFRLTNDDIDEKKVLKIVDALALGNTDEADACRTYAHQVVALVRFAKQAGFGFFNHLPIGSVDAWHELADHFDVNGLEDTSEADRVVAAAQEVYRRSLADTRTVDFDDMILFPLVKNLRVKFVKDLIIVDEYQDVSPARQALARKFLKPGTGRMVAVGDDRQAIYGFTGADVSALPNFIKSMQAVTMPLSVTWRCPRSVVALANTIVPDIECATDREGQVLRVQEMPEDLKVGDAILCRNTAPLISQAYALIRKKIPAKVEGRAIGEGLKALVNRWKIKTIAALLNKLEDYEAREVQKALAKDNEAKVAEVQDKVATIREICTACTLAGQTQITAVAEHIDALFADGETAAVILATYHRSKGREWDRVILLEHSTRCPSRAAKQDWQKAQESNLAYVAYTRAKETLVFVG